MKKNRKIIKYFLIFVTLLAVFNCEKIDYSDPTYIDVGNPLNVKEDKSAIYFGVIPYKNTIELAYEYNNLLKYLSEKTNQHIVYLPTDQYYKINLEIKSKKISIAVIDPYIYFKNRNNLDIEIIAKLKLKENMKFSTYIVARNDKTIKRDEEFFNYTIALDNPDSFFGYHLAVNLLEKENKKMNNLKNIFFSSNMENIAQGVLTGNFDIGAIDTLNYFKFRYRAIGLKVIYQSEPYETYPIVVQKNLNEEFKKRLKKALLELNNPEILKSIDENLIGFEPATIADYAEFNL